MDRSPPGSSVHGILQASILGIFPTRRDWTWVSCLGGGLFTIWATREFLRQGWSLGGDARVGIPKESVWGWGGEGVEQSSRQVGSGLVQRGGGRHIPSPGRNKAGQTQLPSAGLRKLREFARNRRTRGPEGSKNDLPFSSKWLRSFLCKKPTHRLPHRRTHCPTSIQSYSLQNGL